MISQVIAAIDGATGPTSNLDADISAAFGEVGTDLTSSLSNAQSIIPTGWRMTSLSNTDQGWLCVLVSDDYPDDIKALAVTESYAICKASLLANQFEMTGNTYV